MHASILLLQTYDATVFVTQILAVLVLDPHASLFRIRITKPDLGYRRASVLIIPLAVILCESSGKV